MSHFACAVIVKDKNDIEKILAPYSENLEVPRYVEYTKEQLINKGKKEIEKYKNGTYAEYLNDPVKYKDGCSNKEHIKYLEEEFPKKLNWTGEEIYADQIRFYEEEEIGDDGEVYSTYNPNSKWDWYDIGGRFRNALLTRKDNDDTFEHNSFAEHISNRKDIKKAPVGYKWVNGAKIKDIDFDKMNEEKDTPFHTWALVDEYGWYEKGKMGWWGMNDATEDTEKEFIKKFQEYIKAPENIDKYMIIVDCHI